MIKKLIVEEFIIETERNIAFFPGEVYSHFKDPETGKYYRPKKSFSVTGENLEELFDEIIHEVMEV